MLRLAVPENLSSSPELPFDLILFGTGQRGHFGDVCFVGMPLASTASLASCSVLTGSPQLHHLRGHEKQKYGLTSLKVGAIG